LKANPRGHCLIAIPWDLRLRWRLEAIRFKPGDDILSKPLEDLFNSGNFD
jgi:hypothetical protein